MWRELAEMRGCPPALVREATEALAIHHEHRLRDLPLARQFALGSLAAARMQRHPLIGIVQPVAQTLQLGVQVIGIGGKLTSGLGAQLCDLLVQRGDRRIALHAEFL